MEDADDVGLLWFSEESLFFQGDHISLKVPYAKIKAFSRHNVGSRGLWICGQRIRLDVDGLADHQYVEFYERQSKTVQSARKISKLIVDELNKRPEGKALAT